MFNFSYFWEEINLWYGVTLAKLDPNQNKTERYKLSLVIITFKGFIYFNWIISLGLLDTDVVLYYSTFLAVWSFFSVDSIDLLTVSSLFLMEIIDAWVSSAFSTFYSSVSFSSLTFLSLVSLPVFSNSWPIKLVDIASLLLNPYSVQASNRAVTL